MCSFTHLWPFNHYRLIFFLADDPICRDYLQIIDVGSKIQLFHNCTEHESPIEILSDSDEVLVSFEKKNEYLFLDSFFLKKSGFYLVRIFFAGCLENHITINVSETRHPYLLRR